MDNDTDTYVSVEPNISHPPFLLRNYSHYVEVGSYVCFVNMNGSRTLGRVISHESSMLRINIFILNNTLDENVRASTIKSRYIRNIDEVIQTTDSVQVSSSSVVGILLVFKFADILCGKYSSQGVAICYVLRYQLSRGRTLCQVPDNKCLPFPCSNYSLSYLNNSYPLRIWKNLCNIRRSICRILCRRSEKLGRDFIKGDENFNLSVDCWAFIKNHCCSENGMECFGPFEVRRRDNIMRSHLDYVGRVCEAQVEYLRFDSAEKMSVIKKMLGEMIEYGVFVRPTVGETLTLEPYHSVSLVRPDEISAAEAISVFKRRNIRGYGIDLKYNLTLNIIYIYVRYCLLSVLDEQWLGDIVQERNSMDSSSETSNTYSLVLGGDEHNGNSSVRHRYCYTDSVNCDAIFIENDVLYSVMEDYSDGMEYITCEVTEADDTNLIGNRKQFSIDNAHTLIMQYLRELYNN